MGLRPSTSRALHRGVGYPWRSIPDLPEVICIPNTRHHRFLPNQQSRSHPLLLMTLKCAWPGARQRTEPLRTIDATSPKNVDIRRKDVSSPVNDLDLCCDHAATDGVLDVIFMGVWTSNA